MGATGALPRSWARLKAGGVGTENPRSLDSIAQHVLGIADSELACNVANSRSN